MDALLRILSPEIHHVHFAVIIVDANIVCFVVYTFVILFLLVFWISNCKSILGKERVQLLAPPLNTLSHFG